MDLQTLARSLGDVEWNELCTQLVHSSYAWSHCLNFNYPFTVSFTERPCAKYQVSK